MLNAQGLILDRLETQRKMEMEVRATALSILWVIDILKFGRRLKHLLKCIKNRNRDHVSAPACSYLGKWLEERKDGKKEKIQERMLP